jgi:hypothetical protein
MWSGILCAFKTAVETPTHEATCILRAAVTESAANARKAGLAPERAVVALKAALATHGGGGWRPSLDTEREARHTPSTVYAKMFAWFVDAFYTDEATRTPAYGA